MSADHESGGGILFASTGWYGFGHVIPVLAIAAEVRTRTTARVSLFTTSYEAERLAARGEIEAFDTVHLGVEDAEAMSYRDFVSRTMATNRRLLAAAIAKDAARVVVSHWTMLTDAIDRAATSRVRCVGLLEETRWGSIRPAHPDNRYLSFVDDVIFCDSLRAGHDEPDARVHRVGFVSRDLGIKLPGTVEPREFVLVSAGSGSYVTSARYLRAIAEVARLRAALPVVVALGPRVDAETRSRLRAAADAQANLSLLDDPPWVVMRRLICAARLYVHAGGISSTAESVCARTPFLVVNPVGPITGNDLGRVDRLARADVCRYTIFGPHDGPEVLALAIDRALGHRPLWERTDPYGAARAAELIVDWSQQPVVKATALRSLVAVLTTAESSSRVHLWADVERNDDPSCHVIVETLDRGASRIGTLFEHLQATMHRLNDIGNAYGQTTFVVVADDESAEHLVPEMMLPRSVYVVTRGPASIEAEDVTSPHPILGRLLDAMRRDNGPSFLSLHAPPRNDEAAGSVGRAYNPFRQAALQA